MKNTFIILYFLIIVGNSIQAQPTLNEYRINNNIDKFVGTWKWTLGQDEVIINLKKVKFYFTRTNISFYEDVLMGTHKYVKSGIVIEDKNFLFPNIGQNLRGSIFGGDINDDANKTELTIRDQIKYKKEILELTYVAAVTPQLIWNLYERGGYVGPPKIQGITLPTQLVLIKQ